MIRNDFVSNSSSSSYIISSSLPQEEIFKTIIDNFSGYPDEDMIWLNRRSEYVYLMLDMPFYTFCPGDHLDIPRCYNVIIKKSDLSKYIVGDKICVTPEEFINRFEIQDNGGYKDLRFKDSQSYWDLTACVVPETIKFTQWFVANCCENGSVICEEIKKISYELKCAHKKFSERKLRAMLKNYTRYINNKYKGRFYIDFTQEEINKELLQYENKFSTDKKCYIIRFGYSGEGLGNWIYTDSKITSLPDIDIEFYEDY